MITLLLVAAILYGIAITWLYVIAKLDCQKMAEEYNYRLKQQKEQDFRTQRKYLRIALMRRMALWLPARKRER